jgi:hypothetical protein
VGYNPARSADLLLAFEESLQFSYPVQPRFLLLYHAVSMISKIIECFWVMAGEFGYPYANQTRGGTILLPEVR